MTNPADLRRSAATLTGLRFALLLAGIGLCIQFFTLNDHGKLFVAFCAVPVVVILRRWAARKATRLTAEASATSMRWGAIREASAAPPSGEAASPEPETKPYGEE